MQPALIDVALLPFPILPVLYAWRMLLSVGGHKEDSKLTGSIAKIANEQSLTKSFERTVSHPCGDLPQLPRDWHIVHHDFLVMSFYGMYGRCVRDGNEKDEGENPAWG